MKDATSHATRPITRRGRSPQGDRGTHARLARTGALLLLAALLACGNRAEEEFGPPAEGSQSAADTNTTPQPAGDGKTTDVKAATRNEQLLPRLEGDLLGGGRGSTDVLRSRRGVLFFFASADASAAPAGEILQKLQKDSAGENIAFLGVAREKDRAATETYAKKYGLDFPILLDGDLAISAKIGARAGTPAIAVVDTEGYLLGAVGVGSAEDAPYAEAQIREVLRLPNEESQSLLLGVKRSAPDFSVSSVSGGQKIDLASIKGKVAVLIFFLHTCPHCHDALKFLNRFRKDLDRDDFVVVPVSLRDAKVAVEDMARELDIQLPLYLDPDHSAQDRYRGTGSVPNIYVLDKESRIVANHEGMDGRIGALITMEVRNALGVENPVLLSKDGYSGEATCSVCHEGQHQTWSLTQHAFAFDTLVQRGEERNEECLACHTVGFKQNGGYDPQNRQAFLEGVQCENCHGRGGPHKSPEFTKDGYEKICTGCHNTTHSLRFNFAERLPLVSHAANQQFAGLSLEDRRALLQKRDKRNRTLFDDGEFVGSAACQSCHQEEHKSWAGSDHAKAFATLKTKNESGNAECQACHTTGKDKPGGFPKGGAEMETVGCESCHGPGKRHATEKEKKGTILALHDKCDSCVILQICGSCHDDQNDKGFEFNLEQKLDKIRHGPLAGKKDTAAK